MALGPLISVGIWRLVGSTQSSDARRTYFDKELQGRKASRVSVFVIHLLSLLQQSPELHLNFQRENVIEKKHRNYLMNLGLFF